MTHVDARIGTGETLPGPAPLLFFAPSEAAETIKALGPEGFAESVAQAWAGFVSHTEGFVTVAHRDGLAAAQDVFSTTLDGGQSPDTGIVIRL